MLPPGKVLAFVAVHKGLLGIYLGCTFAPNHKGMPAPTPGLDVLRRQVLTSRNVRGGRVLDVLLGGLGYQIEHNLFTCTGWVHRCGRDTHAMLMLCPR